VVHRPIELIDDAAVLPESPGLGVSVDAAKVDRYRHAF
jgi:L-alanine-DL-glutamate epimerase-like enolase superfamily enzyme